MCCDVLFAIFYCFGSASVFGFGEMNVSLQRYTIYIFFNFNLKKENYRREYSNMSLLVSIL
jgi:hypothetical protein